MKTRDKRRQRRDTLQSKERRQRPGIGSDKIGNLEPWGGIRSFGGEWICMCLCVWEGGYCCALLWLFSDCVFLMLISPSCWKAKHSLCTQMLTDVLCTTLLPLKLTHRSDSNTYSSDGSSRDNVLGILQHSPKPSSAPVVSCCALAIHCSAPAVLWKNKNTQNLHHPDVFILLQSQRRVEREPQMDPPVDLQYN